MRRTGIFTLCAVLAPQVAAAYGVRLSAIPEAYRGTWVPTAEICQDADKSGIVLSAKAYVTSAVSCAVDYVAETPSSKGPIYSARLQCSNNEYVPGGNVHLTVTSLVVAEPIHSLVVQRSSYRTSDHEWEQSPRPARSMVSVS
jgi:hypothetical protein